MDSGGRGETELSSRRPSCADLRATAERAPGSQCRRHDAPEGGREPGWRPATGGNRPGGGPRQGGNRPGGGRGRGPNGDGGFISKWLAAAVPGARPMWLPEGMAKRVTAGSRLVIQVHYTATGAPQEDQCSIGLVFADPKTVRKEVVTDMVVNPPLRDSARRSELQGRGRARARAGRGSVDVDAAHSRPRHRLQVRSHLPGWQEGSTAERAAIMISTGKTLTF